MKCFKVYYQDLVGRLDPVHLATMPALKQKDASYPSVELGELLREPPQYGSNQVAINGNPLEDVRYIRITDIDEFGNIRNDDWKTAERIEEKYLLRENDILFARSGATAGKAFIYQGQHGKAIFAGYLIRFILDSTRIKPLYLFYYTQSDRYGLWVKAIQRPSGQPNINSMEFKSLEIPLPPLTIQNQVVDIMQSAYQLKKQKEAEAQSLLDSIDEYVLGELGIISPELEKRICYLIESKVIKNRIDPEHYIPVYTEIANSIKEGKYPLRRIKEVAERIVRGFEPQAGKEYDYIQLGCIDRLLGRITQTLKITMPNIPMRAQQVVKHNEILFSISLPQMGAHTLVEKEHDNSVVSSGFTIIRATNCNADYLLGVLRLKLFLNLCQKYLTGAGLFKTISNDDLFNLRVPHPPIEVQEHIASVVKRRTQKAETLQQEAAAELVKAKVEVEHLILGT